MVRNQWGIFRIAVEILTLAMLLLAAGTGGVLAQSGNRVWDASQGMNNSTYTWNAYSFSGFYYDLDDNLSTEQLTINNIKRTIDPGDVSYATSPIEVSFNYPNFGKYQIIGFMADRYFAGYTANSTISDNKIISTIGNGQLQKVLFDDETQRVVYVGGTLTLMEGYVLQMKEIDVGAGPGQVWVVLLKDGVEVDNGVVAGGNTYIYKKQVGGISDLPILAVHFDSVFRGTEVNAAFIKGLFQISDSYTHITGGDRYGEMEITGSSQSQITMDNSNAIDLSPANTVDLMGNLKIIVADNSSVLRFALSVGQPVGTFDVRGTIYPVTDEWTPLNFGLNIGGSTSIGFYYDMDAGIGTEMLKVNQVSGTSIPDGQLTYSTSPQEVSFDYDAFGSYQVVGFMADKYFAGYTANSAISGNKKISTIASGQLQKILLDDKNTRVATVGSSIILMDGYVLIIKEVDVGAGPGQAWISLLKDGVEVDNSVVAGGNTYVYTKKVGNVADLPIIAVNIQSVFRGTEVNAAFAKGIFQISDTATSVKGGDTYGLMEISSVSSSGIEMNNPSSIGFSRGSTVDLMGNITFKVADSDELRFYPFVTVVPEMTVNQLVIDAPPRATAGDMISITVTAAGNSVEGASVAINSSTGQTDSNGVFNYTLPRTLAGTYNITATKLGYQPATKSIAVQKYAERSLSINAPASVNQFDTITIQVTYNGTAVSNATVSYDNTTIGQTDNRGALNYTLETGGTHTISASKSGYITASRDINVRLAFSEFKALDINITPNVVSTGGTITVRSNITNAGTKKDTLPAVLVINSTEVENRSVTLAPGEIKEINFTRTITLSAGNYTVEILGKTGVLMVEQAKITPFNGTVIAAGAVFIIYLLFARRRKGNRR